MKRYIYLSCFSVIFCLFALHARAQFPYTLTVEQRPYVPLNIATTAITTNEWFDNDVFLINLPFYFSIESVPHSFLYLLGGNTLSTDTDRTVRTSSFFLTDANLVDRSFLDSAYSNKSPIRYRVTGSVGSRIFQLEISNAGFFNEILSFTMHDSVNMQIWLYEGTNEIDLIYGPSKISHANNYFSNGGRTAAGFIKDIDYNLNGMFYFLKGLPTDPIVVGDTCISDSLASPVSTLSSFPASGTVYHFTPRTGNSAAIKNTNIQNIRVYPTACNGDLYVDNFNNDVVRYSIISISGTNTNIAGMLINGTTRIDINTLPAGMYLLDMQSDGIRKTEKFVKL